jgi:signal transduction histidine kinase
VSTGMSMSSDGDVAQVLALMQAGDANECAGEELARARTEIVALARRSGDAELLVQALLWRLDCLRGTTGPQAARAALDEARSVCADRQDATGLALCDAAQSAQDLSAGQHARALLELRKALLLLDKLPAASPARLRAEKTLADIQTALGMHEEAVQTSHGVTDAALAAGDLPVARQGRYLLWKNRLILAGLKYPWSSAVPADDREATAVLEAMRRYLADVAASVAPTDWAIRRLMFEQMARMQLTEEAVAWWNSFPADRSALADRGFEGLVALHVQGPDQAIESMLPWTEPAAHLAAAELEGVWLNLAQAYEAKGDDRAALHATREAFRHADAEANRVAKAQAALLSLELDAEREKLQAQQALTHAGKLAAVGKLAGSLAQEVNQPAVALMAQCQAARAALLHQREAELNQCVDDIEAGVTHLAGLVNRMKEFSRDDPVRLDVVNLRIIVEEGYRLVKPAVSEAGVRCIINVPDVNVRTDKERVVLALVNLINNALDAMKGQTHPEAALRIETEANGAEANGVEGKADAREVRLSVIDNGPGLSDAVLARISQPFFTTKTSGGGLGLGLTITREALLGMSSALHAGNDPRGGARFSISLAAADTLLGAA